MREYLSLTRDIHYYLKDQCPLSGSAYHYFTLTVLQSDIQYSVDMVRFVCAC